MDALCSRQLLDSVARCRDELAKSGTVRLLDLASAAVRVLSRSDSDWSQWEEIKSQIATDHIVRLAAASIRSGIRAAEFGQYVLDGFEGIKPLIEVSRGVFRPWLQMSIEEFRTDTDRLERRVRKKKDRARRSKSTREDDREELAQRKDVLRLITPLEEKHPTLDVGAALRMTSRKAKRVKRKV